MHEFDAEIRQGGMGGAFVEIPFDVEQAFGRKRVPVRATIDGVPYRGSLVRMGGACHMLGVVKDIRQQLGRDVGDVVHVTIEEDLEERTIDVPADLAAALQQDAAAAAFFEKLSFTHRREYVQWIEEAKKEETRRNRVVKAVAMLKEGKRERR